MNILTFPMSDRVVVDRKHDDAVRRVVFGRRRAREHERRPESFEDVDDACASGQSTRRQLELSPSLPNALLDRDVTGAPIERSIEMVQSTNEFTSIIGSVRAKQCR